MNNNDWHHHITILHPRDMSRSLAHVRPRPVTRHVVPASVTGPHHRAVLHVTYNNYTRVTCRHTTRIPTWLPCAAAAAAAPLSGWLASQLVKLPSAAPSAQAKLPSVTKSWRPSQDTSEPMRPWRRWHVLTQSAPCPPDPNLHHAVLRGGLDLGQGAALRNAAAQRGQPVSRAGEYLINKYF